MFTALGTRRAASRRRADSGLRNSCRGRPRSDRRGRGHGLGPERSWTAKQSSSASIRASVGAATASGWRSRRGRRRIRKHRGERIQHDRTVGGGRAGEHRHCPGGDVGDGTVGRDADAADLEETSPRLSVTRRVLPLHGSGGGVAGDRPMLHLLESQCHPNATPVTSLTMVGLLSGPKPPVEHPTVTATVIASQ